MFRALRARPARLVLAGAVAAAAAFLAPPAQAAGGHSFYVAPGGSDAALGTAAAPFQHIQRCAQVMVAGDSCTIASGTYHETVVPVRSGTAAQPITYRAAPGAQVTVDGTKPVQGWKRTTAADVDAIAKQDKYAADSDFSRAVAAGRVYSAPADLGTDATNVQVFTDRAMDVEAQWPYPGLDLLNPALEHAGAGSDGAVVKDAALTRPAGYWDGARALTGYWYSSATTTVKSSSPGSVELAAAPPCFHKVVPTDTRYALSGKIGELAHPGEWFYDPGAKRLYVYSTDDPSSHRIEAKSRDLAFDLTQASHLTLRGIGVFASTIRTGPSSTGVDLDGITGRYLSHYTDITRGTTDCGANVNRGVTDSGIVLDGTGNRIVNSDLAYSAGNGVALLGHANTASDNVIHDVDYLGTYAAAVAVAGNGQTVAHNTLRRVGRSGINLQFGGDSPQPDRIAYNDISEYARLNLDTAAVYTCCGTDMVRTSIDHNLLHDGQPTPGVTPFAVAGVYADNGQSNTVIANNVGWNNLNGTVMLNGLGSGSYNNGVWNNTGGGTVMYVKGPGQSTGTELYNNIGTFTGLDGATDGGMKVAHNLSGDVDPKFVDAANHDYRLTADSPARMQAVPISGVNDGSTDSVPSLGAYQYGAPKWTAGARR